MSAEIKDRQLRDLHRLLDKFSVVNNRKVLTRSTSNAIRFAKSESKKRIADAMTMRAKKFINNGISSKQVKTKGILTIRGRFQAGENFKNKLGKNKLEINGETRKSVMVQYYKDSNMKERFDRAKNRAPLYFYRENPPQYYKSPIIRTTKAGKRRVLYGPNNYITMNNGSKGQKRGNEWHEDSADKYLQELDRLVNMVLAGE